MNRSNKDAPRLSGPCDLITSESSKDAKFEIAPQEVVLIASLEIAVRDSHGEYLLVISPRYETSDDTGPVETSHWAPPYVARGLTAPPIGWRNVGQVRSAIEKAVKDGIDGWRPQDAIEEMISTWACGLYQVELTGAVTEYKRSWNTPGVMKVYHVMRFRINDDANTCVRRALADPDSRKGFSFLPIDESRFSTAVHRRDCERHGGNELVFVGKPMLSNLARVVDSKDTRAWLREQAVEISRDDFYAEHAGVLVCGDIANYGRACQYARDHMHGMKIDDEDSDVVLRDLATVAITRIFHDAGLSQVHTAGDGFIAATPANEGAEAAAWLQRFLDAYRAFTDELDRITERLRTHSDKAGGDPPAPTLGSRIAVHYGPYRYGKMAQAASLVTSFDGAAVIDVARHEQGLRALTKDSDKAAAAGLIDGGHAIVFSAAGAAAVRDESDTHGALLGGAREQALSSKEAHQNALVRMLWQQPDVSEKG